MKKTLLSSFALRAFLLVMAFVGAVNSAWADSKTVTAAALTNNTLTDSPITLVFDKQNGSTAPAYNAKGEDLRLYAKGTVTISCEVGNMEKIVFNLSDQGKKRLAPITASEGTIATQASGDITVTWTGNANEITFTVGEKADFGSDGSTKAGQLDFSSVEITYTAGTTPGDNRQASDLTVSQESIEIDLSVPQDVRLVATTQSTGAISYTGYDENIITVTPANDNKTAMVTAKAVGTTKIIVAVEADDNYKAGSKEVAVKITDSSAPQHGTADAPYTVAEVLALYANNAVPTEEVYVKGIISKIKSLNPDKYTNAQYYISDDGTETNQFYVYNGKYLEGADFTANDQIQVGDEVVVCGKLTSYQGTDEFAAGSKIVSLTKSTKEDAGLAFNGETDEYSVNVGESFQAPTLSNPNQLPVTFSSSNENVATVDASGNVTIIAAGVTTITATSEATDLFKAGEASYTLTVTDLNAPGQTQKNPYTVAQAIDYIKTLGTSTSGTVYVKGIISQVDSYNSNFGSITYWISDDGTTDNQMQVYSGLNLNQEKFTAKGDLSVGDEVIVCGNVKMYVKSGVETPEFDKENYLVEYKHTEMIQTEIYIHDAAGGAIETIELKLGESAQISTTTNLKTVTPTFTISDNSIVKYEDGVLTALAAGTATITFAIEATSEYTAATAELLVKVTDPNKVVARVEALDMDFTVNEWDLPVGSDAGAQKEAEFTNGFYSIALAASTKYYFNKAGYLMLGKSGSTLTLPAFQKNVQKIAVVGTGSASEKVGQNIFVGDNAVSTETEGAKDVTNVYEIAEQYQAAGNIYTLQVTTAHNTQISHIYVFAETGDTYSRTVTPDAFGTICLPYDATVEGAVLYTISGKGEGYITLTEAKAAQAGVPYIFQATASELTATYTGRESAIPAEANGLVGTIGGRPVAEGKYVIANNEVAPCGTGCKVADHRAYIDLEAIEGTADEAGVKLYIGESANGIATVKGVQSDNRVYNLAGQRVNKALKGIYIVNGKKVVK